MPMPVMPINVYLLYILFVFIYFCTVHHEHYWRAFNKNVPRYATLIIYIHTYICIEIFFVYFNFDRAELTPLLLCTDQMIQSHLINISLFILGAF